MGRKQVIPADVQERMAAAYRDEASIPELSRTYGYPVGTVGAALRRLGVVCRRQTDLQRKYPLNTRYFAEIDTPKKAYWLGFVAADGSMAQGKLQVAVHRRDRYHLEKFRVAVGSGAPVYDYIATDQNGTERPASAVSMNSVDMARDLAAFGIQPNKSHTLRPWCGSPELLPHYWRGVFDGDGTIHRRKKRHNQDTVVWEWSVVGSRPMMRGLAAFILDRSGHRLHVLPHKSIWRVRCGGVAKVHDVLRTLYNAHTDATTLSRKAALAAECLAQTVMKPRRY